MSEDNKKPAMFYCGAQLSADGDMLPNSFTVFENSMHQDSAIEIIMTRIAEELEGLEMETANGMMVFQEIVSWQQFAEIKIADEVKTAALVDAIIGTQRAVMTFSLGAITDIAKGRWSPGE